MTVKELRARLFEVKDQNAEVYFRDENTSFQIDDVNVVSIDKEKQMVVLQVDFAQFDVK